MLTRLYRPHAPREVNMFPTRSPLLPVAKVQRGWLPVHHGTWNPPSDPRSNTAVLDWIDNIEARDRDFDEPSADVIHLWRADE